MIDTKGCIQLIPNDTYLADSCLIPMEMSEEAMALGVIYCGPGNTSHKGFCLATLEKLIKYWLVGSYIGINSNQIVTGDRTLLKIGSRYSSRKVLGFIATEGSGSTEPGDP